MNKLQTDRSAAFNSPHNSHLVVIASLFSERVVSLCCTTFRSCIFSQITHSIRASDFLLEIIGKCGIRDENGKNRRIRRRLGAIQLFRALFFSKESDTVSIIIVSSRIGQFGNSIISKSANPVKVRFLFRFFAQSSLPLAIERSRHLWLTLFERTIFFLFWTIFDSWSSIYRLLDNEREKNRVVYCIKNQWSKTRVFVCF